MRVLITGSSGHLGEALMRVLGDEGVDVVGLDLLASPYTTVVGSVADRGCVRRCLEGADAILHTATLHKPHVGSHRREDFVHTNVEGTLVLLEEAVSAGVPRFVFTSTTSAFGRALVPAPGEPAAWITEDVRPVPRNIYGATKVAAEDVCELVHRDHGLPCLILRTSRFFPEGDDRDDVRATYEDLNVKVNELLYRRVDIEDVVSAHRVALERAPQIGFGRYIISATTPFAHADRAELRAARPRSCGASSPATRTSTRSARGRCSTALSACTTTRARVNSSAGSRATTSPPRSSGSPRARIRAARLPWRSAPRATTRPRPGPTPCVTAPEIRIPG